MRTTDLYYFSVVAKAKSLTQASETLQISQPSLSLRIKKLEEQLKTPLLIRSKSGIRLTPGGERLLIQSKQLLQLWDDVKQSVYDAHNSVEGQVTLGCHPVIAMHHIPNALPQLLKDNPKLSLKLFEGLSREVNAGIVSGEVDLGIVVNPIRHPDLIIIPIRKDKIGFWLHQDLVSKKISELTLLCDPKLYQTDSLIKRLREAETNFSRTIDSQSLPLLATLAIKKVGVAIIPESVATSDPYNNLVNIYPDIFYIDEICLVYRVESRFLKSIQAVKNCLL